MERGDSDALIRMITCDATWSMPPIPTWYRGREAIRRHLVRDPLAHSWKHRPARANGQLAIACYLFDPATEKYRAAVLNVLTLQGDMIAASTGFMATDLFSELQSAPDERRIGADTAQPPARRVWFTGAELFSRFDLPHELPA